MSEDKPQYLIEKNLANIASPTNGTTPRNGTSSVDAAARQALNEKFVEVYRRVISAPPEFRIPMIHSAVIDLVNKLEKTSYSEHFDREKAKMFYASFFTRQYHQKHRREIRERLKDGFL